MESPAFREAEGSEGSADDTGQGLEMSETRERRQLGKGRVVMPLPTGAPGVNRAGRLDTRESTHSWARARCSQRPSRRA